jgi:uncharacterized membrane protein
VTAFLVGAFVGVNLTVIAVALALDYSERQRERAELIQRTMTAIRCHGRGFHGIYCPKPYTFIETGVLN